MFLIHPPTHRRCWCTPGDLRPSCLDLDVPSCRGDCEDDLVVETWYFPQCIREDSHEFHNGNRDQGRNLSTCPPAISRLSSRNDVFHRPGLLELVYGFLPRPAKNRCLRRIDELWNKLLIAILFPYCEDASQVGIVRAASARNRDCSPENLS